MLIAPHVSTGLLIALLSICIFFNRELRDDATLTACFGILGHRLVSCCYLLPSHLLLSLPLTCTTWLQYLCSFSSASSSSSSIFLFRKNKFKYYYLVVKEIIIESCGCCSLVDMKREWKWDEHGSPLPYIYTSVQPQNKYLSICYT